MTRIAHDRNGEKTDRAGAAARGVEIDPTDARQISCPQAWVDPPAEPLAGSSGSSGGTARYPDANRAANPNARADSIISMAKSGSRHGRAGAAPRPAGFPSLLAAGRGSRD